MSDTASTPLDFTLVRVFDAPRERVFGMWRDGAQMARWSAPTGFTITEGASDFRPDGAWRVTMVAPDGSIHRAGGRYRDIAAPARIAMSHGWLDADGQAGRATLLELAFDNVAGQTRFTLHQSGFAGAAERDGHRGGWSECLEKLASCLHE